jgi:hypothetical protein
MKVLVELSNDFREWSGFRLPGFIDQRFAIPTSIKVETD